MQTRLSHLLAALLISAAGPDFAAEPGAKTPSAPEASAETLHPSATLRVWVGSIPKERKLRVAFRDAEKTTNTPIADRFGPFRFGEYDEAPIGTGVIDVFDDQDASTPRLNVNVHLLENTFWTLLIQEIAGSLRAEMIDDTPPPPPALTTLRVRNLAPALTTLTVDAGQLLHAQLTSPRALLEVRGLPSEKMRLETTGIQASGAALQWTNDIDLGHSPRTTLLIFPDPYGRIRPRVVFDTRP